MMAAGFGIEKGYNGMKRVNSAVVQVVRRIDPVPK